MLALAIVLAVLIIISALRFGVGVEYSENGLTVRAAAGPLSFCVLPRKEKPKKDKKKADRKKHKEKPHKEKKKKEKKAGEKAPGSFRYFREILTASMTALTRVRRRLLIKRLTIRFISAGDDPSKTAMTFGGASAAFRVILPVLEKHFRIKRRDLRASADFNAEKPKIYVNAAVSLAVWEAVYIALALLPLITKRPKKSKAKTDTTKRKEEQADGKAPDKRPDGDDNAKNPGDGRR